MLVWGSGVLGGVLAEGVSAVGVCRGMGKAATEGGVATGVLGGRMAEVGVRAGAGARFGG